MRAILIAAATGVAGLAALSASAQSPLDPPAICNTWRTQWGDVSADADAAPMRTFLGRVPATCRNLRGQIERFIAQRFSPVTPPTTTSRHSPQNTRPPPAAANPCDAADTTWASLRNSSDVAGLERFVRDAPASCDASVQAQARLTVLHQQATAQTWRAGREFDDCNGAGWCPRMVVIPAGSFMMGAPDRETGRQSDEIPQHRVTIRPFAVGKFEVTFNEWDACVNRGGCDNSGPLGAGGDHRWGRGTRPMIEVSWDDARSYVQWLSRETRQTYRLVTEAEWEYAARAGTTTPYSTGSSIRAWEANFDGDHRRTQPVGSYQANPFGVHDMHGNVGEWVQDCYAQSYTGSPTDGSAHETTCYERVYRGGGWTLNPQGIRSANRHRSAPTVRYNYLGFRVARTLN